MAHAAWETGYIFTTTRQIILVGQFYGKLWVYFVIYRESDDLTNCLKGICPSSPVEETD